MSGWKATQPQPTIRNTQKENKAEIEKYVSIVNKLKKTIRSLEERIKDLDSEIKKAYAGSYKELQAGLRRIKLQDERLDKKNAESKKIRERAEKILRDNVSSVQDVEEYQAKLDVNRHRAMGEIKRDQDKIAERKQKQDVIARNQSTMSQNLSQREYQVKKREELSDEKERSNNAISEDLSNRERKVKQDLKKAADVMASAVLKAEENEKETESLKVARAKATALQARSEGELAEARALHDANKNQSMKLAVIAKEQREREEYLSNWEKVNRKDAQKLKRTNDIKKRANG